MPGGARNVVSVSGPSRSVRSVELADGSSVEADLLVTATGWTAPTSLLNMAGDRPAYDEASARFFPDRIHDTVLATGGLAGDGGMERLLDHARATGRLAAGRAAVARHRLQAATARARPVVGPEPDWPDDDRPALPRDPHPALFRSTTHGMVDFSEDVGSKDLVAAAAEGYDSVELLKRYTTATMGPAQGKLETVNTVAVLAEARGETIGEVGTTVWRPPYAPITLGGLAGRVFEPVRVSSIQPWHEANGVVPIVAGAWIRPEHYGDPAAEVRNTRTNVGITDVTPLGKLDLRGPDVPLLLSQLYTNKWMKLPIGSVRYGIMCAEDGVVLDDGVTGRLGEDHYLMTTTSSGAATVWEWVENWLQTEHPEWRVHVTPVTTGLTSINVAGPNSRELLRRLVTDIDLDPEAFRYMQVRTGTVAGVADGIVWRIGFTGERSYELHVPSGHGLHVWNALLAAGADLGVAPVRAGGTADHAAGEGSLHRRPGHRRAHEGAGHRDGRADQARQGRLRRQAGAGLGPGSAEFDGAGRHPADRPDGRSRGGGPDRPPGHQRDHRAHHVVPDVAHPRAVDLPRPGRARGERSRVGADGRAGRRSSHHGPGDGAPRPLRSGGGAAPWLTAGWTTATSGGRRPGSRARW